jgi:hypothetical protein
MHNVLAGSTADRELGPETLTLPRRLIFDFVPHIISELANQCVVSPTSNVTLKSGVH